MSEVVSIVIGGESYDKPFDPSCPVCMSPFMIQADSFLAYGWPAGRILRYLGTLERQHGITQEDLGRHVDHLAAPHYQARLDYEASAARSVSPDGFTPDLDSLLRLVLQRAYERITDSSRDVSVRDAVALAKLKREIERDQAADSHAASAEQYQAALTQLLWIARKHLGGSWAAFAADVRSDELIAAATGGQMAEPAERRDDSVRAVAGAAPPAS